MTTLREHPRKGGKRAGAGRPPLPAGAARDVAVKIRLTPDEVARLDALAAAGDRSRSKTIASLLW